MKLSALFETDSIALTATAIALVLLASILYVLDVGSRVQRLFALLLFLRGLTFLIGPLRSEATTASMSQYWLELAPYVILPVIPVLIAFLSLYPTARGLARIRWGLPLLGIATLGLLLTYFLDHSSYGETRGFPAGYAEQGPLFILNGLRLPALAAAGWVLAGDYRRHPHGSAGFSLFLLVAAFTLNALFDGTLALRLIMDQPWAAITRGPYAWTSAWLPLLALPIAIATCVRLVPVLLLARSDRELQEVTRFFFAAVPLALASGILAGTPKAIEMQPFLLGTWRLLVPLLLAYSLMRYQLFDLDLRIKASVRRGILVTAFVGVFFLVSETAEALLAADKAPIVGVAAAGLLAVAGKPIQALAGRAANSVMPDTHPFESLGSQGRFLHYRDQFRLVSRDGEVSAKERRMLERLAGLLGFQPDEARQIELGTLPNRDDPAPPAPRPPVSQTLRTVIAVTATALVLGSVAAILETLANPSSFLMGLVTAGVLALLLGPLEAFAERITRGPPDPVKLQVLRNALAEAWEDGELSGRDRAFLEAMRRRLGLARRERRRLERDVLRAAGLRRPAPWIRSRAIPGRAPRTH